MMEKERQARETERKRQEQDEKEATRLNRTWEKQGISIEKYHDAVNMAIY